MNWRQLLLLCVLATGAANSSYADIISQALFSFPAETGYVEYENLASLRKLGDYDRLKQRFSGKPLQEVGTALSQLGIQEVQVDEMVAASSPKAFYGVVAGAFSEQAVMKIGFQKGPATQVLDRRALCPGNEVCILFLEDSVAAFGPLSELKEIVRAREGFTSRLNSNRTLVSLLTNTNNQAPVRGALMGGQLKTAISDMLKDWTGWKRDWSQVSSNVRDVGYSLKFDNGAHITATLDCRSAASATLLLQMLRLLDSVASVATLAGNTDVNTPFRNLQASSSGATVALRADTAY